ncbi:unnamed protein product [Fraxinus pennsylvanica]|uniref:Uncharacterized protein n=1 Tax=Fraxinus pennsylvanica TaxID=56036 RepID=A0AAD1Z184_9LAMI|nr:unnamed protein product [Fraxinus pennsylvanica]
MKKIKDLLDSCKLKPNSHPNSRQSVSFHYFGGERRGRSGGGSGGAFNLELEHLKDTSLNSKMEIHQEDTIADSNAEGNNGELEGSEEFEGEENYGKLEEDDIVEAEENTIQVEDHNHPLVVTAREYTNTQDKDEKIQQLTQELHRQDQLCAAYRERLLSFLASVDEQAEQLSLKVQAVVDNVKKAEAEEAKVSSCR